MLSPDGFRSTRPRLLGAAVSLNSTAPSTAAKLRGPFWNQVEAEAQSAFLEQADILVAAGAELTEIELPPEFTAYPSHIEALMVSGLAIHHGQDLERHPEQISSKLRALIEQARSLPPLAYAQARQAVVNYHRYIQSFPHVDAILTPVTTGSAPLGLENTGSPILCALWTLCGFPAISIPIGTAKNGLPLAVQLVGQPREDARLLSIADWIVRCSKFAMN